MVSSERMQGLNVLYVEDDDITREMASRMLTKFFKSVVTASDGKVGLEEFNKLRPDIIITDLSMPVMSGFEMIEKIRQIDTNIPIIVTTAYRSEADDLQGVEKIVLKPVNKKLLMQAVEELDI